MGGFHISLSTELRTTFGWTQEKLAKEAQLSRRTIAAYEAGTVYPRTLAIYERLAKALQTDVKYLRTENEEFMEDVNARYGRRGVLQAKDILEQTAQLFAGGSLSEDDELAFITEMQRLYLDSKERAKKFTPKRYLQSDNAKED